MTGSVLVHHRGPADTDEFSDVFRSLGLELIDLTLDGRLWSPGTQADLSASIESTMRDLNKRVSRATEGRMDLRTLVPLALLAGGLIKLMFDENWKAIPPYVLLYYAFDTYMKLNDRPSSRARAK